jgi:hypothetical protein
VADKDFGKGYVLNRDNGTISVCTTCASMHFPFFPWEWHLELQTSYQKHIVVGPHPGPITINDNTHIVYIGYPEAGTISAIDGFKDRVAVGAIFKVNPPDSGVIKCNSTTYPTNTYIYVDSGTNCSAQQFNSTNFEFNSWTESPLTNRNSTTPIEQSSEHPENITVDRYGIFTANFKLPSHLTTDQLLGWLTLAISVAVAVNGVIMLVPEWRRARNQRRLQEVSLTHLKKCMKMIEEGKSHKSAIEDKIFGYYVDGKLIEEHRRLLMDKISEYYGSVKGSESGV